MLLFTLWPYKWAECKCRNLDQAQLEIGQQCAILSAHVCSIQVCVYNMSGWMLALQLHLLRKFLESCYQGSLSNLSLVKSIFLNCNFLILVTAKLLLTLWDNLSWILLYKCHPPRKINTNFWDSFCILETRDSFIRVNPVLTFPYIPETFTKPLFDF